MSWNEEQKGYFGTNPQNDAQWRGWQRAQDDRAAAQARAASERAASDEAFNNWGKSASSGGGSTGGFVEPRPGTGSPTTLGGTARAMAWLGLILAVFYVLGTQPSWNLPLLIAAGLAGAAVGAVAGVLIYGALIVLRLALVIAGWAIVAFVVVWVLSRLG